MSNGGLTSYFRKIDTTGTSKIDARGSTFVLRNCTAPVQVILRQARNDQTGESYTVIMKKGQKLYAASEFSTVEMLSMRDITNLPEDPGDTIEVLIGYGDYQEPPPNIQAADQIEPTGQIDLGTDGGETNGFTLISDTNGERKTIHLQVLEVEVNGDESLFSHVVVTGNPDSGDGWRLYAPNNATHPGMSYIKFDIRGPVYAKVISSSFCLHNPRCLFQAVSEEYNGAT